MGRVAVVGPEGIDGSRNETRPANLNSDMIN